MNTFIVFVIVIKTLKRNARKQAPNAYRSRNSGSITVLMFISIQVFAFNTPYYVDQTH